MRTDVEREAREAQSILIDFSVFLSLIGKAEPVRKGSGEASF
jgi:hypothetical protein